MVQEILWKRRCTDDMEEKRECRNRNYDSFRIFGCDWECGGEWERFCKMYLMIDWAPILLESIKELDNKSETIKSVQVRDISLLKNSMKTQKQENHKVQGQFVSIERQLELLMGEVTDGSGSKK